MNCPEPLGVIAVWLTREQQRRRSAFCATPPILKPKTDGGYGAL